MIQASMVTFVQGGLESRVSRLRAEFWEVWVLGAFWS